MKPRVCVIANPAARGGRNQSRVEETKRDFGNSFSDVSWHQPERPELIASLLGELSPGDWVVAIGGDGTVHQVVRAMHKLGSPATLAVLPLGTGNDFAYACGLGSYDASFVSRLLLGEDREIDVGLVWADDGEPVPFVNAVGIGLDAAASVRSRRHPGWPPLIRYGVAAITALSQWTAVGADISSDDWHHRVEMTLCTIGNGPRSGGAFQLTPDASLDDGQFDICLTRRVNLWQALGLFPKVLNGGHVVSPLVTMETARSVQASFDRPVPVHADGEILGESVSRIKAEIRPLALTVRVPSPI